MATAPRNVPYGNWKVRKPVGAPGSKERVQDRIQLHELRLSYLKPELHEHVAPLKFHEKKMDFHAAKVRKYSETHKKWKGRVTELKRQGRYNKRLDEYMGKARQDLDFHQSEHSLARKHHATLAKKVKALQKQVATEDAHLKRNKAKLAQLKKAGAARR